MLGSAQIGWVQVPLTLAPGACTMARDRPSHGRVQAEPGVWGSGWSIRISMVAVRDGSMGHWRVSRMSGAHQVDQSITRP